MTDCVISESIIENYNRSSQEDLSKDLSQEDLSKDLSQEDLSQVDPCFATSNSIEDHTYLEDLASWGRPPRWVPDDMRRRLLPITFDYLRFHREKIEVIWDRNIILDLRIARNWNLDISFFSPTPIEELQNFLLRNKHLKLSDEDKIKRGFRPIESGIICGGYKHHGTVEIEEWSDVSDRSGIEGDSEFIIIISAPNRRGDPGRLYILNF